METSAPGDQQSLDIELDRAASPFERGASPRPDVAANVGVEVVNSAPAARLGRAKRDLKAGERLDGGGGYTVCGLIERADVARKQRLLPLGLSPGAVLKQPVAKGEAIAYGMVELGEKSFLLELRREQDEMKAGGGSP